MRDTRIFDWLDIDGCYPLLYVKSLGLRWGNDEATKAIICRFQERISQSKVSFQLSAFYQN